MLVWSTHHPTGKSATITAILCLCGFREQLQRVVRKSEQQAGAMNERNSNRIICGPMGANVWRTCASGCVPLARELSFAMPHSKENP